MEDESGTVRVVNFNDVATRFFKEVFVGRDYRRIGGNVESKPHKFRERSDKYESMFNHVSTIELCVSMEAPQDNHILSKHKSGPKHKVEFSGAYGWAGRIANEVGKQRH